MKRYSKCCVEGCSEHSLTYPNIISYHNVPCVITRQCDLTLELSQKRRRLWLEWLEMTEEQLAERPLDRRKVCGRHFIKGKPAVLFDWKNPDWVPSVNLIERSNEGSSEKSGTSNSASEGDLEKLVHNMSRKHSKRKQLSSESQEDESSVQNTQTEEEPPEKKTKSNEDPSCVSVHSDSDESGKANTLGRPRNKRKQSFDIKIDEERGVTDKKSISTQTKLSSIDIFNMQRKIRVLNAQINMLHFQALTKNNLNNISKQKRSEESDKLMKNRPKSCVSSMFSVSDLGLSMQNTSHSDIQMESRVQQDTDPITTMDGQVRGDAMIYNTERPASFTDDKLLETYAKQNDSVSIIGPHHLDFSNETSSIVLHPNTKGSNASLLTAPLPGEASTSAAGNYGKSQVKTAAISLEQSKSSSEIIRPEFIKVEEPWEHEMETETEIDNKSNPSALDENNTSNSSHLTQTSVPTTFNNIMINRNFIQTKQVISNDRGGCIMKSNLAESPQTLAKRNKLGEQKCCHF